MCLCRLPSADIAPIEQAVREKLGDGWVYRNTCVSGLGRYLGGEDVTTIHVFNNYSHRDDVPWDDHRTVHVLNGKVLEPF